MFTGLIREIAEVIRYDGQNLRLKAKFRPNLGDSIAVNGACLSVTELYKDGFCVELSLETRSVVAVENYQPNQNVHIEPAMKLEERIDGHLVQGHIDYIGEISSIKTDENGTDFFISLPNEAMKLMANKGSLAVEGVSLTINEVVDSKSQIRLTIIPITMKESLFGEFKLGRRVNIESDVLARYVARVVEFKKGLSWKEVDRILAIY